ncbi:Dyp-type peroxidase [Streptomyces sp. NPDC050085]|uniref:Dyp-type peroxidase n=1 Tax=Streptomyces sp. NPDC050085 TaxID=3365600 RepID=UPI0037AACBA3
MNAAPRPARRRTLLTSATAVLASALGCGPPRPGAPEDRRPALPVQAGVAEPQPRHVTLLAFDLAAGRTPRLADVRRVLTAWGTRSGGRTVTVAVGPGLYRTLGLRLPRLLRELPAFPGDRLDPAYSGGDLLVQVCADDPGRCARAVHRLTDRADGVLTPRWRQDGFLPPHRAGQTPRNLFGFKDGTENPARGQLPRWVWDADGGTYLVHRRIHMDTRRFTALPASRQEEIIGRHRASGAPLGADHEHTPVDLYAKTPQGRYVVPADAHVRLAHSRLDGGARMLRRGYSYDDGNGDQGLLFLAYMRDPGLFVRVQERLAAGDAMAAFTQARGSAIGYVLPCAGPSLGDGLR